jgi:hypothetical protein
LPTGAAILAEIGDVTSLSKARRSWWPMQGSTPRCINRAVQGDPDAHEQTRFAYLRLALWQAASMSILHDEELKAYYHKKRAEGKVHRVAMGAVCRKLLIRIYVILKENRPYVPGIHPSQTLDS